MNIACIGGGPGGLYSAILLKLADPGHEITVYERNAADDTFGFGVVFSQETLDNLATADPVSFARIEAMWRKWSAIDIDFKGFRERSDGHSFAALPRKELLLTLSRRAKELGVVVQHQREAPSLAELKSTHDLVIAGDGVNSATRDAIGRELGTKVENRPFKYAWFGTDRPVDCFTFVFVDTPHGMFWAHIYPYDETHSTFLVETDPDTWRRAGLDEFAADSRTPGQSDERSMAFCEEIFAGYLDGHRLIGNNSGWLNFRDVSNDRWFHDNVVIIGDAAHTAHFSIGSGTKQALEDAITLVSAVTAESDVKAALKSYEAERRPVAASLRRSAMTSLRWFESIHRYTSLPPEQFVFQLLTRSQRITHDNLRVRDPLYVARVDDWFHRMQLEAGNDAPAGTPPMFYPLKLRDLTLKNRVAVSPMAQYSAVDGMPTTWHLVHLGSRAVGGAGLVITEMTCVSPEGRITPGCPGIWNDEQANAWSGIVDFVHQQTSAKIALQIGHAGRKASTKLGWEGTDDPLESGGWPIVAPSAIPYRTDSQVPHELTGDEIAAIVDDHVAAARRAESAGFDMIELHFAHGYLVSGFLSPLSNRRTDEYGGDLRNRARFAREVLTAVRDVWPADKPISVRLSATDWVPGGFDGDDAVTVSRWLKEAGADIVDVSTGQTSTEARPEYGRLYQTPFSDRIRHETGVPTMTVGAVSSVDDVNTIIVAGRADLCLLARPHLVDPYWTMNAALDLDWTDPATPPQYLSGLGARRRAQVP
ncbi:bifunctional salicylyl-CoA 5-hydroxylase/oxidoreductase [Streptomyces fulvoviolaceus]|uniref:bifunctional salicylyl-CoA 5-hydroxylase/oxidoreductase n=1 Tax=Streptomyces fulvoviolaceus TaxID=285535 RepID=UPI0006933A94|nr:bifunctional salicylyl-CoA 5-hydroxylase/oxidoreductase [Streptomyces fulvoviolaceus]